MIGIIKVLKEGFGFIKSEENEGDVFFHANNLIDVNFDDLNEGDTLSFEIGEGKNGKQQANEVTLVTTEEA
jgi:cold shock protein